MEVGGNEGVLGNGRIRVLNTIDKLVFTEL